MLIPSPVVCNPSTVKKKAPIRCCALYCPQAACHLWASRLCFHTFTEMCDSHATQSTHCKSIMLWLLVHSQSCTTVTTINFRAFSAPSKEKPRPICSHSHSPSPRPLVTLICFLSVWICLLCTSHCISGLSLIHI